MGEILDDFDGFIRSVDKNEKTKLKTMARENLEERTIKRDFLGEKRALQIKWDGMADKYHHLHCKHCGNSWARSSGLPPDTKFQLQGVASSIITCRSCGSKWRVWGTRF